MAHHARATAGDIRVCEGHAHRIEVDADEGSAPLGADSAGRADAAEGIEHEIARQVEVVTQCVTSASGIGA